MHKLYKTAQTREDLYSFWIRSTLNPATYFSRMVSPCFWHGLCRPVFPVCEMVHFDCAYRFTVCRWMPSLSAIRR